MFWCPFPNTFVLSLSKDAPYSCHSRAGGNPGGKYIQVGGYCPVSLCLLVRARSPFPFTVSPRRFLSEYIVELRFLPFPGWPPRLSLAPLALPRRPAPPTALSGACPERRRRAQQHTPGFFKVKKRDSFMQYNIVVIYCTYTCFVI